MGRAELVVKFAAVPRTEIVCEVLGQDHGWKKIMEIARIALVVKDIGPPSGKCLPKCGFYPDQTGSCATAGKMAAFGLVPLAVIGGGAVNSPRCNLKSFIGAPGSIARPLLSLRSSRHLSFSRFAYVPKSLT